MRARKTAAREQRSSPPSSPRTYAVGQRAIFGGAAMRRFTLLVSLIAFLFFAGSAMGQQVVLHVPGEYATIQDAVNQAGNIISGSGSTPTDVLIEVSPG